MADDRPSIRIEDTIYLHNPNLDTLNVSFTYIGATSSATPGTSTCAPVNVAPGNTVKTSLTALCPTLNAGRTSAC